jgi:hypothetical protein
VRVATNKGDFKGELAYAFPFGRFLGVDKHNQIRARFIMADLPFSYVKTARNTSSIPALFAVLKNKSAHYKLLCTKNN